MALHLRVRPVQQTTRMSCWWACMRMVLTYYGRAAPWNPGEFNAAFRRPLHRPRGQFPTVFPRMSPQGEVLPAEMPPYEWYDYGVPMNVPALRNLCQLTGFTGVTGRPAFGSWTLDKVEEILRRCGPFLFLGNWNRQGFHAVLVVGRVTTAVGGSPIHEVKYIDPASGQEIACNIQWFNTMMSSLGASSYNPLYLPNSRPIRATD